MNNQLLAGSAQQKSSGQILLKNQAHLRGYLNLIAYGHRNASPDWHWRSSASKSFVNKPVITKEQLVFKSRF
jgi:hypothetical protein